VKEIIAADEALAKNTAATAATPKFLEIMRDLGKGEGNQAGGYGGTQPLSKEGTVDRRKMPRFHRKGSKLLSKLQIGEVRNP